MQQYHWLACAYIRVSNSKGQMGKTVEFYGLLPGPELLVVFH